MVHGRALAPVHFPVDSVLGYGVYSLSMQELQTAERFSIGQVARAADVGVETVRFYEREGLIPEPPRLASGYRQYPAEAVDRIRFIRRAKQLGFSLKEIGELLELRADRARSAREVKALAQEKIADVERKILELERMKRALERLEASCSGHGHTSDCPILEALEDHGGEERN